MDKYEVLNHSNDMCVLCLLEYTHDKSCRERRIYKSILKRYGRYQYDFQLEQALLSKGYIEKDIPSNPLQDEPDIPPITTQTGRNAIKYGVFKSETGICFGNIWVGIIKKIANRLFDFLHIFLSLTNIIIYYE